MIEWRQVPVFPDYDVSTTGHVRSWRKSGPGTARREEPLELKLRHAIGGYRIATVISDSGPRQALVHHLVLEAWVGPRPQGKEAAHEDGDPSNNRLSNLRWATKAENEADKTRHGTVPRGERHRGAKLISAAVLGIRAEAAAGVSFRSLGRKYGVAHKTISLIHARRAWAHLEPR